VSEKAISGILNINKPAGITSHDVVNQVRGLIGIRKVGHAGTLDPMATGVLLICIGQATRLAEYLMKGQKVYRATVLFGQATDTYDADGETVSEVNPSILTKAAVNHAFLSFVGRICQVPPPFSAIKKGGIPLYKLAREGVAVKPKPRIVQIDAIKLVEWDFPKAVVEVICRSGTYIRSLAHDVGQALEVGAHLTGLVRVASGEWHIKDTVSLQTLTQVVANGTLDTVLHPKERALTALPQVILTDREVKAVRFGQSISHPSSSDASVVAGYDTAGKLVAIFNPQETGKLKPKKVFNPDS
jgi:tRNA pseudouridine55 synthase